MAQLLFRGTQAQLPAPTWDSSQASLTAAQGSNAFFWAPQLLHSYADETHIYLTKSQVKSLKGKKKMGWG